MTNSTPKFRVTSTTVETVLSNKLRQLADAGHSRAKELYAQADHLDAVAKGILRKASFRKLEPEQVNEQVFHKGFIRSKSGTRQQFIKLFTQAQALYDSCKS